MKKLIVTLSLLTVLLASVAVGAPKDIKMPPIRQHTLDNGLKVYIVETREVPLVTIRLLIPVGAAADPEGRNGIAGLTATMILRGAGGIGAEEMAELIENTGGSLESAAGSDLTQIYGDFMARDLELGIDLLARTVMQPDLPQEEFDREKGIVTAGLMSQKEDPYGVA
ncbi:MAG TPA: insulinase family protein, partial [Candidatus Krumholzibacterium sp.]|nr:insulinase family protein [Candidatus Krumholzibacterium sp.]